MPAKNFKGLAFSLGLAAYFLIALEILIMITPFAVYFYSVYGPMLEFLSAHSLTNWSVEFFLPHMVFTGDALIKGISFLQVFFILGILLFLFAAIPLYYTRIFKKSMVTGGAYLYIRHPQYLSLSIAGFGLLIYWPRFIILILYVTMLFVYYLLARNEEWRMKLRFGNPYEEYMRKTPMFLPGEPGKMLYRLFLDWIRPPWLGIIILYTMSLVLSQLLAFSLRSYSVNHIPKLSTTGAIIVPVFTRPEAEILELYRIALSERDVREKLGPETNLAYLMPGDFFLMALVTDEPRKFSQELVARFPEILEWHSHRFEGGIGRFFRIFYNFTKTISADADGYDVERFIFVSVKDRDGNAVRPDDTLRIGLQRSAEFIVDIDTRTKKVLLVKSVPAVHKWGKIPMPVF